MKIASLRKTITAEKIFDFLGELFNTILEVPVTHSCDHVIMLIFDLKVDQLQFFDSCFFNGMGRDSFRKGIFIDQQRCFYSIKQPL